LIELESTFWASLAHAVDGLQPRKELNGTVRLRKLPQKAFLYPENSYRAPSILSRLDYMYTDVLMGGMNFIIAISSDNPLGTLQVRKPKVLCSSALTVLAIGSFGIHEA
jgi:hypothetical protein